MTTTIILPISRDQFLPRVFASLEALDCDREHTNLLAYVDGDTNLYVLARNAVEQSKFNQRLCVQGDVPGERKDYSINARRRRIAAIHNAVKELIEPCDYVFLIEDGGVLPAQALAKLLTDHLTYPHAGFIEGVELGRHGLAYIGGWRADDVYEPTKLESVMPGTGLEEIDAGGLYATLMRYDLYRKHEFKLWEGDAFGPDIQLGFELRRLGYQNYIDWGVSVEHMRPDGSSVHPRGTDIVQVRFRRDDGNWRGAPSAGS